MPAQQPKVVERPHIPGIARNTPPKPADRNAQRANPLPVVPVAPAAPIAPPAPQMLVEVPYVDGPQPDLSQIFASGGSPVAPVATASEPPMKKGGKKKATAAAPQPATLPIQNIPVENRPPSTLAQYIAQQREEVEELPSIESIFSGQTAEKPISGIVKPYVAPPPPPPAAPPVTYVVEHKLPDYVNALIITQDYGRLNHGGQVLIFMKGQMVTETSVVEALLRSGVGWFEPYDMGVELIQCPCPCGHKFPLSVQR